jgi:hypothetical protein
VSGDDREVVSTTATNRLLEASKKMNMNFELLCILFSFLIMFVNRPV